MKRFIFVLLLLAFILTGCSPTLVPIPKSDFVLLTYVFKVSTESNDLAILAETSDGNESSDFPNDNPPTLEDVKNQSTTKPYADLPIMIISESFLPTVINTDINGHLDISFKPTTINDIYPENWTCVTLTSWTTPSESSLDPGGGGILQCQPK